MKKRAGHGKGLVIFMILCRWETMHSVLIASRRQSIATQKLIISNQMIPSFFVTGALLTSESASS